MNEAHRALREGTRGEHERLDALMGGFDLADRESYAAFLAAHAEALAPMEAALDRAAAAVIGDWPARRRGAALAADLAALGVPVPPPDGPPDLSDPAAAAGALYVVEGSRLGGRFLARMVGAGLPVAYLSDSQPRGRWPALLAALEDALPDAAARSRAIVAAVAVFGRFEAAARRRLDPSLCAAGRNL